MTSQLWANVFLDGVDHAMAAACDGRRYLRYVDDIAVFSDNREELEGAQTRLSDLLEELRMRLHAVKTGIVDVRHGVNFLGFRFFPERVRLRQDNLRRARRRMRGLQSKYRAGVLSWSDVRNSLQSWNAHAAYGDTWRLRERVFDSLVFARS